MGGLELAKMADFYASLTSRSALTDSLALWRDFSERLHQLATEPEDAERDSIIAQATELKGWPPEIDDQVLVPPLAAAHQRIYARSVPLEDARAQPAYGQHSQVRKILEIHQELPGESTSSSSASRSASEIASQPNPPAAQEAAYEPQRDTG